MLDEPSLGLAPVVISELFNIIVELNNQGLTVLLSEQNARKALKCAHRGYVFSSGRIVLSGTSDNLIEDPKVHQAFLGGGV